VAKDSAEKGLSEEAVKLFDLAKVHGSLCVYSTMIFSFIHGCGTSIMQPFCMLILQNHEKALVILNKLLSQVRYFSPGMQHLTVFLLPYSTSMHWI